MILKPQWNRRDTPIEITAPFPSTTSRNTGIRKL
jgi:hypothetical protein